MGLLVDAPDLRAELVSDSPPVVLDVRWTLGGPPGRGRYDAGHVPGARYVDLDSELAGSPGPGGRHPLPPVQVFEVAMRRAGVSDDSKVVVYDEADGAAAARAWWCLRYFGQPDVRVLDGGYRAWVEAGLPIDTELPAVVAAGNFVARPGGMWLLDAAGAARLARDGMLLDARSEERYRGEREPVDPVAGHIPGAVSAPASDNADPTGRFHAVAELRRRFAALGVDGSRPVGSYCGSGVTAAQQVLALAVADIEAALYVGSWSEWVTDPRRPVATGADPGIERAAG